MGRRLTKMEMRAARVAWMQILDSSRRECQLERLLLPLLAAVVNTKLCNQMDFLCFASKNV
jgi:hypothetical protein